MRIVDESVVERRSLGGGPDRQRLGVIPSRLRGYSSRGVAPPIAF